MSSSKSNTLKNRRKVAFTVEAVDARRVALVGTFNDWNPRKHPMRKTAAGSWHKTVMLPPGAYEYKFWIDGHWQEDPQNEQSQPNTFGTRNNIVHVALK